MVRTKRWLSHFEVARSTPHRAPTHDPTARDKQRVRCDAAPLPPILPDAEDALLAPRPRAPPHRAHQPILPQRISSTTCRFPPLLSYLFPVHLPRPDSAFLSSVTVCVRAARVCILRVRLRGAPLATTPSSRRSRPLPFVSARSLTGGARKTRPRHVCTNTWGAWWWWRCV